jgi:rod shape-determining protein MreC
MEPSRDDFVIAIRSAFLKKGTKQKFSLLGLLFFSILLIVLSKLNFTAINYLKLGINEVVFRTSFIVSLPEKYISYSFHAIEEHIDLYKDYNLTKEELKKIKSEKYNVNFLEAENKRLKKVLEDISSSSEAIIAKVIIDKQSPFLRSIIINKGSKNEIKKGMAVLSDSYLVGKVIEVNFMTSRVLLLSDLNSKIPVTIEPGGIQSILSGNGVSDGVIQYTKGKMPINGEGVIYTSGTGGLLKSGIPIGKISHSENKNNVDFFVDFSQLRFVRILSYSEEKN